MSWFQPDVKKQAILVSPREKRLIPVVGVGKTTLIGYLQNSLRPSYERCFFTPGISVIKLFSFFADDKA